MSISENMQQLGFSILVAFRFSDFVHPHFQITKKLKITRDGDTRDPVIFFNTTVGMTVAVDVPVAMAIRAQLKLWASQGVKRAGSLEPLGLGECNGPESSSGAAKYKSWLTNPISELAHYIIGE